jgi:hypothetical protein
MALEDSDKMRAMIELGKLEHSEIKIIYQFVVGGIISVSVAVLVAVFQNFLALNDAVFFLIGFLEFAGIIYFITKTKWKR